MTQVDFISKEGAQGQVANHLLAQGLNVGAMRPFISEDGRAFISVYVKGDPTKVDSYKVLAVNTATLRRDEWKQLDEAVQMVSRERVTGIQSLRERGLVKTLTNGMGTTVFEYHEMTDSLEAAISMDGVNRGKNDRPGFTPKYMPLPIIHVDYQINARVLAASRNMGNALDTSQAEQAARRVIEKLEDLLFTDTTYSFGGGVIYSYLSHPDRNPQTLSVNWDAEAKTGKDIVDEVLAMKQKAIADRHYGPFELYVPTGYDTVLDKDYRDDARTYSYTIRERILKIDGIDKIKVIDRMPANNVVLVQMTSDTVRLVDAMAIQNVQWGSEGNMTTNFKVMTIQVPQVRSDAAGRCGIVHLA